MRLGCLISNLQCQRARKVFKTKTSSEVAIEFTWSKQCPNIFFDVYWGWIVNVKRVVTNTDIFRFYPEFSSQIYIPTFSFSLFFSPFFFNQVLATPHDICMPTVASSRTKLIKLPFTSLSSNRASCKWKLGNSMRRIFVKLYSFDRILFQNVEYLIFSNGPACRYDFFNNLTRHQTVYSKWLFPALAFQSSHTYIVFYYNP